MPPDVCFAEFCGMHQMSERRGRGRAHFPTRKAHRAL